MRLHKCYVKVLLVLLLVLSIIVHQCQHAVRVFCRLFSPSSWFFRNALFHVSTSKYRSRLEFYWNTKTILTVCSYLVFSSASFLFSSCSVCPLVISHYSAGVWVIHIFGGFLMRTKHENIIPSSGWCDKTRHPFNDAFAPCFIMIVGFWL